MFDSLRRLTLFCVGFTLPLQGFALSLGPALATPFKLATVFLLGVGMLQLAVTGRRFPRDRKTGWLVAYAVSYAISWASGLVQGESLPQLIILASTYLSLMLYYFLMIYLVLSRDDLALVLWGLVMGGAFTALGSDFGGGTDVSDREGGLSAGPNLLGFDMAVCLPISAGMLLIHRSAIKRAALAAGALLAVAGIVLSLSRSAFVSAMAMWGLWAHRFRRLDTLKYLAPALLAVAVALVFTPEPVQRRIDTMIDPEQRAEDDSIQERIATVGFALEAFARSPLVGTGEGEVYRNWVAREKGVATGSIHNAYLHVAVFQGILGLVPFLMLYVLTWNDYTRAWRATRSRRSLRDRDLTELGRYAVFLQIAFLGTIVAGLFHQAQKSKTMWMLFALSPVVLRLVRARVSELADKESLEPEVEDPFALEIPAAPRLDDTSAVHPAFRGRET